VFRCAKSFVSLEQPQLCISKTTQRMRMEFWWGSLHTKAEDHSVCLHTNISTRWGFYISQAFWGFLLWIASGSSPNHPKVTVITRCPHFVCPWPSTRIRLRYDGIITPGGGTGELHAEVMYIYRYVFWGGQANVFRSPTFAHSVMAFAGGVAMACQHLSV
jgi:hypothetical protein